MFSWVGWKPQLQDNGKDDTWPAGSFFVFRYWAKSFPEIRTRDVSGD